MLNFIKNIGPIEWVVIIAILLFLFGGKIVRMLGKTTGEAVKEVRKVKKTFTEALEEDDKSDKKDKEAE